MNQNRVSSILIVDDETAVGRIVAAMLAPLTSDIEVVTSGQEAIEICQGRGFDVVVSDMRMPNMDGVELMRLLAHDYPSMRRVILTGHVDLDLTMKAINTGRVHRYLTKPIVERELTASISEELASGEKERTEIMRLRKVIDQLSSE